jgi:hypothetical protein
MRGIDLQRLAFDRRGQSERTDPPACPDHRERPGLETRQIESFRILGNPGQPAAAEAETAIDRITRIGLGHRVTRFAQPPADVHHRGRHFGIDAGPRDRGAQRDRDAKTRRANHFLPRRTAGEDVQHDGGVFDGPGDGAERRESEPVALCTARKRNEAGRRLEAEHPAASGGNPDRASAVGPERDRSHAGGYRCRTSAARSAGGALGRPGIAGHAECRRLGEWPDRQLGHLRFAHHHAASGAQPPHQLVVGLRGAVRRCHRAEPRGKTEHVDVVLDRHRNAGERPPPSLRVLVDGARIQKHSLAVHHPERAELAVELLDPGEMRQRQFFGARLAAAHEDGDLERGQFAVRQHGLRRYTRSLATGATQRNFISG